MLRQPGKIALFVATLLFASSARAQRRAPDALDRCIDAAEDAQRQRQGGHLLAARTRSEQCLDARCPATIRHDCDELRADVARRIPTVVLRVRDADGRDVPGALVRFDEDTLTIDGRAREIDPGPHEVVASAPGFMTSRRHFVVEEGAVAEAIELRLAAVAAPALPLPTPPPSPSSPSPLTWAVSGSLAGVGLIGLGLFTGLGLSTDSDYRALRDRCEPHCTDAERDSIRRRFQVVDVTLAAGLVASALAVVVYFVGPRASGVDRGRGVARDR